LNLVFVGCKRAMSASGSPSLV
jgi:hypothetical protein